jgi:hypothetical protein
MSAGPLIFLASVLASSLASLASGGCTSDVTELPASVRDRLEASEIQLAVSGAERAGSITALRRIAGGWVEGSVELTALGGAIVATADARGAIRIERFAVDLGPIEIPESVLGYEAQLTGVHLRAERPTRVATMWNGDDLARATPPLQLELTWSLTIRGQTSPLGAPRPAPVPVEILLTGDGSAIHAEAHARSAGVLWSWADLLKLTDLDLSLTASTTSTITSTAVSTVAL